MSTRATDPTNDIQRGDVIFYRSARADTFADFSSEQFDDFAVLAGFGQGLAYVLGPDGDVWSPHHEYFKPWMHVAICVGVVDGVAQVVGFNNDVSEGDPLVLSIVSIDPLTMVKGQTVDILRPDPGAIDVDRLVELAEAQAGSQATPAVEYSRLGLASFALATYARMLPDGDARDEAIRRAYRAGVIARSGAPDQESCVTSVAKVIDAVTEGELCLPEPAPTDPAKVKQAFGWLESPVHQMFYALTGRVWNSGAGEIVNATAFTPTQLEVLDLALRDIRPVDPQAGAVGGSGASAGDLGVPIAGVTEPPNTVEFTFNGVDFGGVVVAVPPELLNPGPTDTTPAQFIELTQPILGEVDARLSASPEEIDVEAAVARGCATADNLVASPAMLWDAMVRLDFAPVQPHGQRWSLLDTICPPPERS